MYEYGSRVGFWRLHRLFQSRGLPLTVFASALALERTPRIARAIAETDWDICAHGYRWVEHYLLDPEIESDNIARAHASISESIGRPPRGFYCRYSASMATRRLVVAHGGFDYDSDAYNDELPYWTDVNGAAHLVVPYTMVTNDAKFLSGDVFSANDFAECLIDSFDVLRAEATEVPRMMSVGLHPRIIGHPSRFAALVQFIDHISAKPGVWVCRRADIADHWRAEMPPPEGR